MPLRRKRRPAAAGLLGVRIFEHEARLHERLLIIERHPVQVDIALWVDEELDAVVLEHFIGRPLPGVELELIAQPRASAAQDAQPETSGDSFALEGPAD